MTQRTKTVVLKPCPKCEGTIHLPHIVYCSGGSIKVKCLTCGRGTKRYATCDEAVAAWNRRTPKTKEKAHV